MFNDSGATLAPESTMSGQPVAAASEQSKQSDFKIPEPAPEPKPIGDPPVVAAAEVHENPAPPPPPEFHRTVPPIELVMSSPTVSRAENSPQPNPEPPPVAMTEQFQALRTQPLSPTFTQTVPAEPATAPSRQQDDLAQVVAIMEEVLQTAERTATGTIKDGGEFATALREGLLEVTDSYPFLDPFAGEFEYRKGHLEFRGTARAAEFLTGTTSALRQALQTFARRFGDRQLPAKVQQSLQRITEDRGDEFQHHGLLNSIIEDIGK
jgi:hypothetical protein